MNRRTCLYGLSALGLIPFSADGNSEDQQMIKRVIPSTDEKLTAVGLGTWQTFDVGTSDAEREPLCAVLKTLSDRGGSVVDSSPMYGKSESVVGELSTQLALNDKLFIATKVWTNGEAEGIRQMNNSFSQLQRKKIDLMQIHNLVDWKTHLKTLRRWKEEGKVRYIGITHYTESAYPSIEQILKSEAVDFLQINYSILSRTAEKRLFPLAVEKNVAVLVNQPFEAGALFRAIKGKELPEWAAEFNCTSWGQFFLKYILHNPAVTCVIPGTSSPRHMLDNIGAAYGKLPDDNLCARMIKLINT